MKKRYLVLLVISHLFVGFIGFGGGIYALPILTAPKAPNGMAINNASKNQLFQTQFQRSLKGSDFLHWGEGSVSLGNDAITLNGKLSPGPDFKLYLSPTFVETEADFKRLKSTMIDVGDVRTFNNFIVPIASDVNLSNYTSVIVWCESFEEFITAAKYR